MAASCKAVTSKAPRSPLASSPIFHLERFTIRMPPLSMIPRRSSVLLAWPRMFRSSGLDRKCPTLFNTGEIASARSLAGMSANSRSQNLRTAGSRSRLVIAWRGIDPAMCSASKQPARSVGFSKPLALTGSLRYPELADSASRHHHEKQCQSGISKEIPSDQLTPCQVVAARPSLAEPRGRYYP